MSDWIEWKGGNIPVGINDLVDIKLRNGEVWVDTAAGGWMWGQNGGTHDIIAYRIREETKVTEKGILSNKAKDWNSFQLDVAYHIETYVVPQYGDKGEDPASDYTVQDLMRQIEKYAKRQGKNAREGQDALDLIKIAHYAQMAHTKLKEKA